MKDRIIIILSILVVGSCPLLVQAVDFEGCKACHEELLNKANSRRFLHPPFAEKDCEDCHAADESTASLVPNPSTGPFDKNKIERLADSGKADTSHGFLLPGEKVGDTLIIDGQGDEGKTFRREIAVPSLADLEEVEDSGRPPVISDVRLLNVQRRLFVSATVGWQTDARTNASVLYGSKDLSQKTDSCDRIGTQHQVVIFNLRQGQTYRFSVVSTDLFGRSTASEPLVFSTANPAPAPPPANRSFNGTEDGEEGGMVSNFLRLGNDYLLELTMLQPAWVTIGSRGGSRNQDPKKDKNRGVPDDESHAELSGRLVSSMGACLGCHRAHSHPVNAVPQPGMTVVPEYPTLPDGRITCSSCHEPHSSNYYYLTRKDYQHELCVGCHTDMAETDKKKAEKRKLK
jgi:predicted CXXCH cytochrome family protein